MLAGVDLEARGATVVWDDNLPGHRRFYSEDPVGNRLEFLERHSLERHSLEPHALEPHTPERAGR